MSVSSLQARTVRRARFAMGACVAVACAVLVAPLHGAETPVHPPELIQKAAADFAQASVSRSINAGQGLRAEVRPGRLDPRLRLTQCSVPLETYRTRGSRTVGRITIGVRCTAPRAWTVMVPLTVSMPGDVLVATRHLPRGTLLSSSDLQFERRDLSRLHNGYVDSPSAAVGMRLKRTLRVGQVLSPGVLAAQKLVRRGTRVTIVAQEGGLTIRASGQALRDGARGDVVPVRNLATKRLVEGVVGGAGIVNVGY